MLGTGSHRYHRQSPQYNTAAELGDRRKEDERGERERRRRRWSSVEAQGLRSRCQVLTEKVQTLCFLKFQFLAVIELVQAKSPLGRPVGTLWIFFQWKAGRVFSQKPSNRIGNSGVFYHILRLLEGYCGPRI